MVFWDFDRARQYVQQLGIKTADSYFRWCVGEEDGLPEKPDGIPSCPHQVYSEQWQGMNDWLGTQNIAPFRRSWLPFEEARAFARGLKLATWRDWTLYASGRLSELGIRPPHIPSNPDFVYRDQGWAGARDWLGTGVRSGRRRSSMRSLEDARAFARALGLHSWLEWRAYVAGKRPDLSPKPADVPAVPHACYKKRGWVSYGDFLGCDTVAWHQVSWRSFSEARDFARALNLATSKVWRAWAKSEAKPRDIPANPEKAYRGEWTNWSDWLGSTVAPAGGPSEKTAELCC